MVLIQLVLICLENLQIAAAAHFFNAILFRGFDTRTATLLQTLVGKDVGQPIQKSPLVAISSTFQKMIMRLI